MDFTVIICTYNREKNLPACITALEQQEQTSSIKWEVLIVDNNSSDDTKKTVARLAEQSPLEIRYAFEPQQGLNHARNLGMKESKGTYFTYVDDDITVSKSWLFSMHHALTINDADAMGGRIHLDPTIQFPSWISKNPEMFGFLGFQDFGEQAMQVDGIKRYPFGGNMAFNRRVIETVGFFNTKLGRKGEGTKKNELFKGAETDYFHRLVALGNAKIFYTPDAIVYHHILPFQLKKGYFLTIHQNAGYQKAFHDPTQYPRSLGGVPLFLFPQTLRALGKYISLIISQGMDMAFRQRMTLHHFIGQVLGYNASYRQADTPSQ
ncbi:MAG: glycosyltransferase [Methyloprofundus sp.]|nr:glycosyltransferase [Methyloprofundus sp.]